LFTSVELNFSEVVKYLIEAGADINESYKGEYPALVEAASNGSIEIVKLLIDGGIDLN
jgi:ankyrin repeat protein